MAARAQRYQRTLGACSGGSEGAPKTNGRLRIDPMLGGGCTEDVVCLCVRADDFGKTCGFAVDCWAAQGQKGVRMYPASSADSETVRNIANYALRRKASGCSETRGARSGGGETARREVRDGREMKHRRNMEGVNSSPNLRKILRSADDPLAKCVRNGAIMRGSFAEMRGKCKQSQLVMMNDDNS